MPGYSSIILTRIGKICFLAIDSGYSTLNNTSPGVLFTIPEGYRPNSTKVGYTISTASTTGIQSIPLKINTNGNVESFGFPGTITTTSAFYGVLIYNMF